MIENGHSEGYSTAEFARRLGIRVPAVRRGLIQNADICGSYLVLERVHGHTLEQLWPEIGWLRTLLVAWQLRRYLQKMHAATSPVAGGLASDAFTGYLNWWLTKCRPQQRKPRHDLTLESPRQHVFVHQDLAPRNMIIDSRNQLWLIDWGFAGFYPPYMEYTAIEASKMPWLNASTWHAQWARWRWAVLRWIAAGPRGPHIRPFRALGEVHRRSCLFRLEKTPYSQGD
ncbi:kinase-like protein [Hygrophoropsis aurantiaca]|uniref:Kinase-like protein n=1 Tax=Hygrophoropsis aurantiaca TaxID=72124 RepID=A0ACB8A058_9AGAM|nr:kinase-like protein [Hygrophoropsis aurantiaca]